METIRCLVCGKPFRAVGHHVRFAHGMTAREYKQKFGLPLSIGAVSSETRARFSESVRGTHESGKLDEQVARLAANAREANALAVEVLAEIKTDPARADWRKPKLSREIVESVIRRIESGESISGAVKRTPGISWTGFHDRIKAFPDLIERFGAAKRKDA